MLAGREQNLQWWVTSVTNLHVEVPSTNRNFYNWYKFRRIGVCTDLVRCPN